MIEELTYTMPNVIALAQIEKECFGKDAWSIMAVRGEFCNSYSHFFAEKLNDKIVGYVCVRLMYEEAQVCNIAVLPDFRRQGIACALIEKMLEFSKEKGCARCELEVNTENVAAIGAYKKCNFEVAGVRKNFYRKSRYSSRDAYTMVKEL